MPEAAQSRLKIEAGLAPSDQKLARLQIRLRNTGWRLPLVYIYFLIF